MNKYLKNMISIAAVVVILLAADNYWVDFNSFGHLSIIAIGVYGICLNLYLK